MVRKLTYDDLWTLKVPGSIALSPDGRCIAFEIQSSDKGANENQCAIFLLLLDEEGHAVGEPRRLTSGIKLDSSPVWAPDSRRLLFLSNREGEEKQLWLIDTQGGEARKLTNMLHGVSEAAWSPDGKWIAFTAEAAARDDDEVLLGRKVLEGEAKKNYEEEARFRLHTVKTIHYRMDGRGLYEKFSQLSIMPAPTGGNAVDPSGIRRLTSGDFDHTQLTWTPDSKEVGLLCNRNNNRHSGSRASDVWAIAPETGEQRCLTDGSLEIECYAWSPDGKLAAVVGAKDQLVYSRSLTRIHLVRREGHAGEGMRVVTAELDNAASPWVGGQFGNPGPYRPQWSEDGQQIYFLVAERGCANIYRVEIAQPTLSRLTSGEAITNFIALLPGGRGLLAMREVPDHPWEFYRLPLTGKGGGDMERLTHLYDDFVAEFAWGQTERLCYQGANGDEIDGWLIYPVGAREGVRYPLMVHIHGGPHWAFGGGIDPLYHYFAAQGYAVFYCNHHGSTGCGEAFMRSVLGDWGGKDFEDILRGVDECIARGVADPERLVVTGYSGGGYLSMFAIGHTDRFKAAVPMAGVSNLASFVGTSDIGSWQVAESQGYPWDPERAEYYRERSPVNAAAHVTTPTLFIHPENDLRCPIEQSEQFYMALKMMGKAPVEFVRAPGAWHMGTPKPSQWLAYWEKMLEWFGRYIEFRPEEYV